MSYIKELGQIGRYCFVTLIRMLPYNVFVWKFSQNASLQELVHNRCTMRAQGCDILLDLNLPRGDAPSRRAINSERYISVRASTTTEKRDCAIIAIYLSPTDLPRRQSPWYISSLVYFTENRGSMPKIFRISRPHHYIHFVLHSPLAPEF